MAKEGELSLKAYKREVQANFLDIAEKVIEDNDIFLIEKKAKILKLEGNMLDKFEKKAEKYYFKQV